MYDRWQTDPLELFFSGHIYPKGAAVLQMARRQLGDSTFWRAMHRYATRHAYSSVVTSDFERSLSEASGRDFSRFFRQWVYGAGLPVFTPSVDFTDANRMRLTDVGGWGKDADLHQPRVEGLVGHVPEPGVLGSVPVHQHGKVQVVLLPDLRREPLLVP